MSLASYLLAFESILYGLIITRIIVQWNKMLQNSQNYQHYWAYYLMTVTMFLLIVYVYMANADLERYDMMRNYFNFLLLGVLPPTTFSFMSYQLFPKRKKVDLKHFYMESRWKVMVPGMVFFSFFTAYKTVQFGFGIPNILGFSMIALTIGILSIKKYWILETYTVILFAFSVFLYLI